MKNIWQNSFTRWIETVKYLNCPFLYFSFTFYFFLFFSSFLFLSLLFFSSSPPYPFTPPPLHPRLRLHLLPHTAAASSRCRPLPTAPPLAARASSPCRCPCLLLLSPTPPRAGRHHELPPALHCRHKMARGGAARGGKGGRRHGEAPRSRTEPPFSSSASPQSAPESVFFRLRSWSQERTTRLAGLRSKSVLELLVEPCQTDSTSVIISTKTQNFKLSSSLCENDAPVGMIYVKF